MITTQKADPYQSFYGLSAPVLSLVATPDAYTGPTYRPGMFEYDMATGALEFHFRGDDTDPACCTATNPCVDAAFRLLATGQAGTTSGSLTRDDDRSSGIDEQPYRSGSAGLAGGPKAPAAPKRRKNAATDNQLRTLTIATNDLLKAPEDSHAHKTGLSLKALLENTADLTVRSASTFIDVAFKVLDEHRGATKRANQAARQAVYEAKLDEGAVYLLDEIFYKVQRSGESGRLYAKKLIIPEGLAEITVEERLEQMAAGAFKGDGARRKLEWAYDGQDAFDQLGPEHKVAQEKVREFGRRFGFCCCCGKILTKKRSIEAGVGPVCADNHGYDY
jgi:hypothetical protein